MAIELINLRTILQAVQRHPDVLRGRLLILGDAQILFTVDEYLGLARELDFSPAGVPISMTPAALGMSMGFAGTDTLDVNGRASITHNLQHEVPPALLNEFSCILDAGVLFWCFDPGVALKNMFRMAREGGVLIHITAVSGFYGRCFYNIHPLLFESFYLTNRCEFLEAGYATRWRPATVARRVARMLGLEKPARVALSTGPGNVFVGRADADVIEFGATLRVPESSILPNNAVGTLAFRKVHSAEPVEPLLT